MERSFGDIKDTCEQSNAQGPILYKNDILPVQEIPLWR